MKHQAFGIDSGDGVRPGGSFGLKGDHAVRLQRPADLGAADRARWADLSDRAGTANVFAQHWFMDPALRHAGADQPIWLAIAERDGGEWIGVLPLVQSARFGRWPVPHWQSWLATNQFLGSPLVRPGTEDRFWALLLPFLDAFAGREIGLQCRQLAWDDPACAALIAHCEREGRGFRIVDRFDRPASAPDSDADGGRSGAKARARLRSLERRLARDHGPVAVDRHAGEGDCNRWVETFLAMERAGWKGRAGSALACHAETENLFRDVMRAGWERGRLGRATLTAAGRPLAMSSWFVTGDRGFGFKMAFDEAFRSYAPGQLLMRHVADHVAGLHPPIHFDTCTAAGAGGCRSLWGDSRTIVDCVVAIGSPARRLAFAGLMLARDAYRRAVNPSAAPAFPAPSTIAARR
ncbi:GNAT family N-acetyltransferase [Sphingopyxis panaciterrulae]|uniref:BioF2-like acetyltransferase domain-containing protein n=1 Tax=Sphingopyxis panaciterrulae TaxID=462372 RepID=A0A7W9B8B1_9SPHN|nr:GNAT family N-acetyltransferase [Sphingopyxis panaciterrulae]MBB5708107.1 hypothetical protein [Sphingopyxis panaciterrulae]